MTTQAFLDHDELMREVARRMESSKLSRRSSKSSSGQTPKRRSIRIEKPRSTHQSPRVPERRKTLTSVRQHATLDDHYRKMFGLGGDDDEGLDNRTHHATRPFSWHPSSAQFRSSSRQGSTRTSLQPQQTSSEDASKHASYAQSLDRLFAEKAEQLDSYSYPKSADSENSMPLYNAQQLSQADSTWSSYMHGQVTSESQPPSYTSLIYEPTSWFASDQVNGVEAYQSGAQRADTLPIQHPSISDEQDWDETEHQLIRQKSDELIGLGLYDPPGSTPPPFGLVTGKGLKLEETWQPPEDMMDADADDESSDEEEEPPRPEDQQFPQTTLPLVNMSGQSFFFDDDDGVTNEWWYQPLKQSSTIPRDGTIGYGWL